MSKSLNSSLLSLISSRVSSSPSTKSLYVSLSIAEIISLMSSSSDKVSRISQATSYEYVPSKLAVKAVHLEDTPFAFIVSVDFVTSSILS